MKSEKAKEVLARSYDGGHICMENAERAVELAEQEAEERVRAKAIKAYCDECACFEACVCCLPPEACDRKNDFIQKLNEE